MTASDVLVESLLDWGVEVIFGLPGDGINGFVESLRNHKNRIRYIHVRHEETAAMAASGYAKFTGKPGVCFATTGPGAIHLMNGLYDAKIDQAPVLAITGMTYHDLIGTSYLQDINQDYIYQNVAIYNQRLMGPAQALHAQCERAHGTRSSSPTDSVAASRSCTAREERRCTWRKSSRWVYGNR
jgi:pyruvate dehydrogenase (quinone)